MSFQKGNQLWRKVDYKNRKNIGFLGKKHSKQSRKKISIAKKKNPTRYWLGKKRKFSKEWIEKNRKSHIGIRKGFKMSDEQKKKLSLVKIGKNGCLANNWQGGKSFEKYTVDWNDTLKRSIRERDKYVCQMCSNVQNNFAFDVHHIDYDKKNCNPDNLITLCRKCHMRTNNHRDYWINYFKKR